jgi:hypothetical protein
LELLLEQGHEEVSTSQKEFEGHAAWVIERERLSARADETEAEALDIAEECLLKHLDPHTERKLPNAEAISEGGFCLFIRIKEA